MIPGILTPPYSPPTAGKTSLEIPAASPAQMFPLLPFSPKTAGQICAKIVPHAPFRGAGGKVFGVLTAARPSANIRDKPRPHGPGPANRPRRDSSGVTHSTVQSAQRKTHSTVQIAQTEKSLRKSLDRRIQPCYDATIPSGTVECKPPGIEP